MVRYLVQHGVNVNADDPDAPISALSLAVLANDVAMAKALIELGTDVNKVDSVGATPLLHAVSVDFGDVEMVRLLLSCRRASGYSVEGECISGRTCGTVRPSRFPAAAPASLIWRLANDDQRGTRRARGVVGR